ncbi:YwpF-like family protein [Bacillus sp. 03113]|uniref:YwpF-like family protein n=1 Tax=Bacillus sp. 03113 TaxID=2578211 RepID=UPI001143CED9|nr:YwpF-like family protein [Bacillus sp. 03113]
MKTFKLITLQIVEDEQLVDVELIDGLIINKEDDQGRWLIEAYTDKGNCDYFQKAMKENHLLTVQAVITKKENTPAAFKTQVRSINPFDKHVSILLEGPLVRSRNNYAQLLLKELIQKGVSGEDLIVQFNELMKQKPSFKAIN